MNGSEKQIKLANEIKDMFLNGKELSAYHSYKGLIAVLEEKEEKVSKRQAKGREVAQITMDDIAKAKEMIAKINSTDDASWFIDNKENQRIIKMIG